MLNEHELTYVVKDEVLLITTREKAESPEFMTRKVYPVGDLVLPITSGGSPLGAFGGVMNVVQALFEACEMPAESAWTIYSQLEEFKGVVFSQFKERLKDHRQQVQKQNDQMERERKASKIRVVA